MKHSILPFQRGVHGGMRMWRSPWATRAALKALDLRQARPLSLTPASGLHAELSYFPRAAGSLARDTWKTGSEASRSRAVQWINAMSRGPIGSRTRIRDPNPPETTGNRAGISPIRMHPGTPARAACSVSPATLSENRGVAGSNPALATL
jgi:hypothetical protein